MFDKLLFFSSFLLTISGAAMVLGSKDLVRACIALLACLFGVAGLYATLNADFLAATQLVVYAGGVVILMLFAIMLTGGSNNAVNRFGINKVPSMGDGKTLAFGILSGAVATLTIFKITKNVFIDYNLQEIPGYSSTVEQIGQLLVTNHVLAFEISSILLLGALIGAAVIARPRKS
ncbi:MAG: NADH-ubiquinone/plastoquinone oxidoreductase chain 6 [Halobacteriovoraceae bacterium]|nr:NADH-ubiquinone/plastoquinone oxidoreductase chain 6 [Halobacteriovoraceae bacterium]MBT5094911.1 NADH-ubiquinone/plastoquinone oxidoreductase chain 6 [Halobacteriovoraceae bacterium]